MTRWIDEEQLEEIGRMPIQGEDDLPPGLADRLQSFERSLEELEAKVHAAGMDRVSRSGKIWTLNDLIGAIEAIDSRVSRLADQMAEITRRQRSD